ncbi:uncharacterized protein LOC142574941 [Dermacentor variabilis]|uniref:uncharacterized protein LOC142574941 n=1 Tax=Dermacentor variabilis TaxID=34621 RepID=UPI003F5BD293
MAQRFQEKAMKGALFPRMVFLLVALPATKELVLLCYAQGRVSMHPPYDNCTGWFLLKTTDWTPQSCSRLCNGTIIISPDGSPCLFVHYILANIDGKVENQGAW